MFIRCYKIISLFYVILLVSVESVMVTIEMVMMVLIYSIECLS